MGAVHLREFGEEISLFGRNLQRNQLIAWPFGLINLVIIIGGFVARRRKTVAPPTIDDAAKAAEPAV